jgi:branched-chain amino acid transport system ATP-binding protein
VILEVRDIHTYYGESHVLQGVSLDVPEGRVVALLGRNGVGKTTLMRSIIGFTPPRRGSIRYRGEEIAGLPSHRIARLGIGLVPQGRRVFPSLDVGEHLTVNARPPVPAAATARATPWTLDRVLGLFPRLRERRKNRGNALSGGEQQMLVTGRALVTNPDLLLLDEPTEGLAPLIVRELGRIIGGLRADGISILLVEQNLGFALDLADHVYVLSKGRIVHASTPDELIANDEIKRRYLGV